MGYYSEVSSDSPYGWFKLDQSSGSSIANSGSAGLSSYTISYSTGLTQGSTGLVSETGNKAFTFSNSAAAAVNLGNTTFGADLNDNNALTLEYVFKITSNSGSASFGRMDASSYGWGFQISVNNSKLYVDMAFVESLFSTNTTGDTGVAWTSSTWYHAAMVYKSDSLKVYINGTEVLSTSLSSYTWNISSTGSGLNSWIWAAINAAYNKSISCVIDDMVIYRTALSPTRITAHAAALGLATVDVTVNAVVSNVSVAGQAATVTATTDATVSAAVTNISVAGQAATVTAARTISVSAGTTDVDILGHGPAVSAGGNIQINADEDESRISITGNDATLIIIVNATINAVASNVNVAGVDSQNLYPSLVLQDNPTHYWKFTLQATEHVIKDFGSDAKDGTLKQVFQDNAQTNLTSSNFVEGINSDFGSNAIQLVNYNGGSQDSSYRQTVVFSDPQPTTIGDNLTYEFWFKTSNSYVVLFSLNSDNWEKGSFWNHRAYALGLIDGKLSTWTIPGNEVDVRIRTNVVSLTETVNDNNWHHIMMTKSTTAGVSTYKSYLDGVQTSVTLSLGNLLSYAELTTARDYWTGVYTVDETDTDFYIGDGYYQSYGVGYPYNSTAQIDDFAIYESALTLQDAIDRYGAGAGSESIEVTAGTTNISVASVTPGTSNTVNVSKSTITVAAGNAGSSSGGNVTIGSSATGINVTGQTSSLTIDGTKFLFITRGEISVDEQDVRTRTDFFNFKFVPASDTALSAEGAETLTELDFLGLLFNQTKKLLFRIGNTDTTPISFVLSIESKSTDILNAITLSYDDINYSSVLNIENVSPNSITEVIYVKFDANLINLLGSGTFLINVERS